MANELDAFRELLKIMGDPAAFVEQPEPIQDMQLKQSAEIMRIMGNALREIAWLNDSPKAAQANIKNAKYKAQIALKKTARLAVAYSDASMKEIAGAE